MARPDLSPVIAPDPLDLRLSLALGQTATNMSKIVGRLVSAGLVVRVAAPADDRGVLVALTDEGRRIGERIMSTAESNMRTLLADWSPAEIEELRRMMARLARVDRPVSERRPASA
jgi:DNA-binding MarR family transcriptional regulator